MQNSQDKSVKRGGVREPNKKAGSYQGHLHKISFDDSDESERSEIPNVFLGNRENGQNYYPLKQKKLGMAVQKQESTEPFDFVKKQQKQQKLYGKSFEEHNQAELELEEQVAQPEPQIVPHSSLSWLETFKVNLGELLFRTRYPMKKTIYINNNNEQQNEVNQKEYLIKNNTKQQLAHITNSLEIHSGLFFLALLLRNVFGYVYIYVWVGIIIFQFVTEEALLNMPIQYGTDKISMIVLLLIAVAVQMVSDWLSFRKRRCWQENNALYGVYHHNGQMAEWVNTKVSQIKAGNIYRLQHGETFPTDCVLLYSERSLIQINQTQIISQLVEDFSSIRLKQTLIKSENLPLPVSGFLIYEISGPEYTDFQIAGRLNLEEPEKVDHGISMSNIIMKGSINAASVDVVCMAMDTGVDALFLKSLQYPFAQRKRCQYQIPFKARSISNNVSQEIKEYEGTMLGCNIQSKVESTIYVLLLFYLLITVLGVLARFAFSLTTPNQFFLSQTTIPIWKTFIYHATNYIIMIPVLLIPIVKLYLVLSGSLREANISKREIEVALQVKKQKKGDSLRDERSHKNEQLFDNKKIIFPLTIKDYNILPQLCKTDTIITTIDTFRNNCAYTLHSIRVKQVNHNFMSNSLDNEAYSISDLELLKHFMSVALLTSTRNEFKEQLGEPTSYDSSIQYAAKKYFELKKNKSAKGETLINGDEFIVKELFHIDPIYQYPYKVIFLEPITDSDVENKKVLVLIRGNPKIMLDKCYGKQVKLTQESRKLSQEKGFHVQLLAKLSLPYVDVMQLKNEYESFNLEKNTFYKNLDKYISKIESMGLLIFVNQFHQRKIGQSMKNPILNKSPVNVHHTLKEGSLVGDIIDAHMMPNMIILAPLSKSFQPQFQSIHTITNLLISPYLFNLSLSEVGDKIYHEKPTDLDRMFEHLDEEKILVWNGWDQKDIAYTVDVMKRYGRNILLYIQKDEYMYLMKEVNCSVKGSNKGYDSQKFSDINLTSRSSVSFLYILQLIKYDSIIVRQGMISILMTQVGKYVFYLIIETINIFFTRGSALMIIKTPLFLVIEGVLFFDVFYYLNWKDAGKASTFPNKASYLGEIGLKVIEKSLQGLFLTLVCIYSTQTPSSSNGTPHPYQYTYFAIAFVVVHILVFQKIFNIFTQSFSIYKGVVILGQMVLIYLGFLIVSLTDKYSYYGILWGALSSGNVYVTAIVCIWISLTVPALRLLWTMLKGKGLKSHRQGNKHH